MMTYFVVAHYNLSTKVLTTVFKAVNLRLIRSN
jgi:hypothetical protein